MGAINWGRVLLGGLLGGVIVNAVEGLSGLIYQEQMRAILAEHGLAWGEGPGMMILYFAMGFGFGIAGVWLYAAVRPRFGPGPKTALRAGFYLWLVGYLAPLIGWSSIGLFPGRLLAQWGVVGLVELLLATLLGAWLYREA